MPERAKPASNGKAPLRLRDVLDTYGVQITELAAALSVTQTVETQQVEPVSRSTLSQIINGNVWPQRVQRHRDAIREQAERWLQTERGIPAEALADCWESMPKIDKRKALRDGHPRSARSTHLLTSSLGEPVVLSQQARRHFSLPKDPFSDDVNSAEDVFVSADQRYVREVMWQAARHGGFVAVVGESGAGKSVLRRELVDRVQREGAKLVLISPQIPDKSRLNTAMICDAILGDLNAGRRAGSLEAKAREVSRTLTASLRSGNSHVLLIEEAHDLNISTLKYLKRFWELEDGFRRLLGIVLIGQLELKAKLDERQHYDAREVIRRIEIAELRPLDTELEAYLQHKFGRVGVDVKTVFAADAYDEVRSRLTQRGKGFGGSSTSFVYPLIVNNLVRKAMNLAAELGASQVSAEQIREV